MTASLPPRYELALVKRAQISVALLIPWPTVAKNYEPHGWFMLYSSYVSSLCTKRNITSLGVQVPELLHRPQQGQAVDYFELCCIILAGARHLRVGEGFIARMNERQNIGAEMINAEQKISMIKYNRVHAQEPSWCYLSLVYGADT